MYSKKAPCLGTELFYREKSVSAALLAFGQKVRHALEADGVEAFNLLASEKLPEAKLKEFVGHTPLQVIAGILLGVANTFIMYYCVL